MKLDTYTNGIVEDLIYETHLSKFIYDANHVNYVFEELVILNALD